MKWAYKWQAPDTNTWLNSHPFTTREAAVQAASNWLKICAENKFYIAVRIYEIEP